MLVIVRVDVRSCRSYSDHVDIALQSPGSQLNFPFELGFISLFSVWGKSLLELFKIHVVFHHSQAIRRLGWYENVRHDVDDAIGSNSVSDCNASEAIDLDGDETAVTSNVNR